jgi:hypothetical protein
MFGIYAKVFRAATGVAVRHYFYLSSMQPKRQLYINHIRDQRRQRCNSKRAVLVSLHMGTPLPLRGRLTAGHCLVGCLPSRSRPRIPRVALGRGHTTVGLAKDTDCAALLAEARSGGKK